MLRCVVSDLAPALNGVQGGARGGEDARFRRAQGRCIGVLCGGDRRVGHLLVQARRVKRPIRNARDNRIRTKTKESIMLFAFDNLRLGEEKNSRQ